MAILVTEKTRVLIQGITGTEGARSCRSMLVYGTRVLAGVTPGKKGQRVEGIPVYDTVSEALRKHPTINTTLITVPPRAVADAALEAIEAGISLLVILTENVPVHDSALLLHAARVAGARIVGPASIGIISPGKAKIGSIGMGPAEKLFTPGNIGIISKSGGMTAEVASVLGAAGFGESTAIGIGGDQLIGSNFAEIMELFEKDRDTKAVVVFGEIGGSAEEELAAWKRARKKTKPIVALIAGKFADSLPLGTTLGHAGAIVHGSHGTWRGKRTALAKAGVLMADSLDDIPKKLASALAQKRLKKSLTRTR